MSENALTPGQARDNGAAARGTIVLGGRTFFVSPPSDSDSRTIALHLRKRCKQASIAKKMQADPDFQFLSEQEQRRLIAEAVARKFDKKSKEDFGINAEDAMDYLLSVPGCRFMAWVVMRKEHQDLKLEDLEPLITEDNVEQVFRDLDEQTGMASLGNSGGRPGSQTTG